MAHEIAQLNVARPLGPLQSPVMAEFVANLDRINALAEGSPGFIWRLQASNGNATSLRPMGEDLIVNMSVWRDVESLSDFVHKSAHVEYLKRRREWFQRIVEAYVVLWWVPAGQRPTLVDAAERLGLLREHGPTPRAFTFRKLFQPAGATA